MRGPRMARVSLGQYLLGLQLEEHDRAARHFIDVVESKGIGVLCFWLIGIQQTDPALTAGNVDEAAVNHVVIGIEE